MKTAILQVADTGPLESLVVMLNSVGYKCLIPDQVLLDRLRTLGCDTVLSVSSLIQTPSYEPPFPIAFATLKDMETADLYVDVKAHRNGPKVWGCWPRLQNKTLWYRINGCAPEHVITAEGVDQGNEVDPPCPVLTPNQWYACQHEDPDNSGYCIHCQLETERCNIPDNAYAMWPPFYRWLDYYDSNGRTPHKYDDAICLINNLRGWGYGLVQDRLSDQPIKFYGHGNSDGEISHDQVGHKLRTAIAMVHLKSNDAPGYAIYEAMAAGCPLIVSRRLIWRSRMESLLIPGETCLAFDQPTNAPLDPTAIEQCYEEIRYALWQLDDRNLNKKIGMAGHNKLKEIMWNSKRDGNSLKQFMEMHYGSSNN